MNGITTNSLRSQSVSQLVGKTDTLTHEWMGSRVCGYFDCLFVTIGAAKMFSKGKAEYLLINLCLSHLRTFLWIALEFRSLYRSIDGATLKNNFNFWY
jgi:hypothetical protein